jgi:hypothetical protein
MEDGSMWRVLVASRVCCSVLLVGCAALLASPGAARASSTFALVLTNSSQSTVQVGPGDVFALNVVVTGLAAEASVKGNLDSFTYRVVFQNEDHVLDSSSFLSPFNGTPPPGGFNGSIPLGDVSVAITDSADLGSPYSTPLVPDIYRTTASNTGVPAVGSGFTVEKLVLRAPTEPGIYAIDMLVVEAADNTGAFHTVSTGPSFTLEVPEATAMMQWSSGLVAVMILQSLRRRHAKALITVKR